MERLFMPRCSGKTTSLLIAAQSYAEHNPEEQILFVSGYPPYVMNLAAAQWKPDNFKIVSYSQFEKMRGKLNEYAIFIDELDSYLNRYNIKGYTVTIGE